MHRGALDYARSPALSSAQITSAGLHDPVTFLLVHRYLNPVYPPGVFLGLATSNITTTG